MVVLHEEGGSGAHAKFTGLPCFTLLRRNSGDNSFHKTINNEYSLLVLYGLIRFKGFFTGKA